MIESRRMLNEVIVSLRNVIAPAIAEPYPKTQAYMAAVILEMVARQVEERTDLATAKRAAIASSFETLGRSEEVGRLIADLPRDEGGLCQLIERLYAERQHLGEELFTNANKRVHETLRALLDQDLKVAGGKAEG